jgi:hypothetical protein
MARYRMYSLGADGHISYGEEIEAGTDEEALARVCEVKREAVKYELWLDRRLVAAINGDDDAGPDRSAA